MHECDFVNRQELQTQLLQFHFSLQPTLQLDSKDSSKRGSSSKPKVKFWPLFGDFHCFFLLQVVKFTHWLICLGWIERSQVREDGRINGEENGKWEEGRWWPVSLSLSVCICLCVFVCVSLSLYLSFFFERVGSGKKAGGGRWFNQYVAPHGPLLPLHALAQYCNTGEY